MYGESDDITGGMGIAGVAEFEKFINAGGLLVTLGSASFFPPEFGLTRTIDAGRTSPQFYGRGQLSKPRFFRQGTRSFTAIRRRLFRCGMRMDLCFRCPSAIAAVRC